MYWYCSKKIKLKAECRNRVYFFHAPLKLFPYLQDPLCCVSDHKHGLKIAKPSILPPGVKEFIQQGFREPWMVEFSGGSRGVAQGARHPPTLIFRLNWDPKGWKNIFWGDPPPSLSKDLDYCPPPPPLISMSGSGTGVNTRFLYQVCDYLFFLFLALADFHNPRKNKELWCWCLCNWLLRLNPAVVAP